MTIELTHVVQELVRRACGETEYLSVIQSIYLVTPTFSSSFLFSVLGCRTKFFGIWAYVIIRIMPVFAEETQNTLFDLSGKEYNAYWVDEKAPLFIPNNPLHWKAHKLQILVSRLEVQAQKNPAQFNSKNYIDALNELEKLMTQITERADSEFNARNMADVGDAGEATTMGNGNAPGVDAGISADNPTTR